MRARFNLPASPCLSAARLVFRPDQPWLAPLAGYSDLPFRLLCREYGAAVCETEMISAKGLVMKSPGSDRLLLSIEADAPLVVQLFGGEPECMGEAVKTLRAAGYDAFDCNMGCPVRKVLRQKAGAALMADSARAIAIAKAMLAAAKAQSELPPAKVGFKLRLPPEGGWAALVSFGRQLEDLGASWLCLHPRNAAAGYGGQADWEAIARLAEAVAIPVIASGDLLDAEAGLSCLAQTGAAAVMYARGSLRNPFIFRQHAAAIRGEQPEGLTKEGLLALVMRHIELARKWQGDRRAFVKMRSIIPRYAKFLPGVNELRLRLCQLQEWESLEAVFSQFLARDSR